LSPFLGLTNPVTKQLLWHTEVTLALFEALGFLSPESLRFNPRPDSVTPSRPMEVTLRISRGLNTTTTRLDY
jgi:hypothetical protein